MACSSRASRLTGIAKAAPPPALAGEAGLALVEYSGAKDRDHFPTSLLTGAAYEYGTERPRFYVDKRDLGRVLNWAEDGEFVFRVVE